MRPLVPAKRELGQSTNGRAQCREHADSAFAAEEYPDAQVAARIGTEVVLVGDLKALAGDTIAQRNSKFQKSRKKKFTKCSAARCSEQVIETKLVYDAGHDWRLRSSS